MRIELDKEQVAKLYNSGMTQKQVGQELGVSHKTVADFMKENDIKTRSARNRTKANYKKVREEKVPISDNVNIGYTPKKIERTSTQKKDNALNLYLPEKWNWRD